MLWSLNILPSTPTASGRRRVMSVGRPDMPTFSSLNLDGNPPIPPSPPTISPPTSPLINPWIPCMNNCNIPDEHCEHCFKCGELCSEHQGCSCEPKREYRIVRSPLDHTRYIIGSKDLWCTQCKQRHETQPMWWFLFCTHLLSIVQYFMFCSLDFVTDLQNEIKKRNTNLDPVACLCQRICFFTLNQPHITGGKALYLYLIHVSNRYYRYI